ncbi:MAG: redoxin domain-containing protein [Clostridia bacterium]|nr:redoxin domain-containing protein [Clostridia bacterium]
MKKTNRAIALLLALIMMLSVVTGMLASCWGDTPDDGGDDDGDDPAQKTTYTVSVKSIGGMAMPNVVVTVYEDATLENLEGYATTDANGLATLQLKQHNGYAIKLSGIPEGYTVADSYTFTGTSAVITLASGVIDNESLAGVTYRLGSVMRDFTVTTMDGRQVKLSELLKTQDLVMLNFWYTTCSWCIEEFPDMQAAYEIYKDDVSIVALNPYTYETDFEINAFVNDYGLTFDVARDIGLSTAFGVTGYPTSVFIDRYGTVCLVVSGAITGQKYFNALFDHFTADNYQQKLLEKYADLAPQKKPDVEMSTSEAIAGAINSGDISISYYPEEGTADAEYSWPFIVTDKDGVACIKTTNAMQDSSYATIHADVVLSKGQALAFDYFSSTERGADMLYVLVDGVNINTISGVGEDWETCYPYVATEEGEKTYKLTLLYLKDSDTDEEDDTVYVRNMRVVDAETGITSPAYIPRWAANNQNENGVGYKDYATVVYNEADGYYHVGSDTGPLLLANMMGVTRFSSEESVYSLITAAANDGNELLSIYDAVIKYCNYASNAKINGISTVDETLKGYLEAIALEFGFEEDNENKWLEFCLYYNAYGTGGVEMEDPIIGLSAHSAYPTVMNDTVGLNEFPNIVNYDRVLMPRGLWYEFTPEKSGAYRIVSNVDKNDRNASLDGWIFLADATLYYEHAIAERFVDDANNVQMYAYFEAGTSYYIDIAFGDPYQFASFGFKIEYLGETYDHYRCVSPGAPFTYELNPDGSISNKVIAGGVKVVFNEDDGYYYNVLPDGTMGKSKIYADFTMWNSIFGEASLGDLIEKGAFNFAKTENDHLADIYIAEFNRDLEALKAHWGAEADANFELYQIDDVYNGVYHGKGVDRTADAQAFYDNIIAGEQYDLNIRGCVAVGEDLAELLQLLMNKYTFNKVENSWVKLCYFYESLDADWEYIR